MEVSSDSPRIEVYNNQEVIAVSESLIDKLLDVGRRALPLVLEHPANGGGVLASLDEVEVSIVDDETIAKVHVDFMEIEGATDVITFAYDGVGELVISVETAIEYAAEYGHSYERELMLYIIHGLLHLCGHEDAEADEGATMESIQFELLENVWKG